MKYRVVIYLAILFTGIIQSCGEAQFFGWNDKLSGRDAEPQGEIPPNGNAPLPDDGMPPRSDLTVVVMIDLSKIENPGQRPGQVPGQRPGQVPGQQPGQSPAQIQLLADEPDRCIRQDRLMKLIAALADKRNQWNSIRVGLVPYAKEILHNWVVQPVALNELEAMAAEDFICADVAARPDRALAESEAHKMTAGIDGEVRFLHLQDLP